MKPGYASTRSKHGTPGVGVGLKQDRLADRARGVVTPWVVGVVGASRQGNPIDLILAGHRVADVTVDQIAEIGVAARDRAQVQRLLGVVDGIVVPEEQPVLDAALVRFRRGAGDADKAFAGPKQIDFLIQFARHGVEIADGIWFVSSAAVPGRAEDKLGAGVLLSSRAKSLLASLQ